MSNLEISKNSGQKRKIEIIDIQNLMPLVKFSSKLNDSGIFNEVDHFSEFENNVFFACIAQFYDHQTNILKFSSEKVRNIIGYTKHESQLQFAQKLDHTFKKFLKMQGSFELTDPDTNTTYLARSSLFRKSLVNTATLECVIQLDDGFEVFFNRLGSWTRFSLLQYTKLHSMYSKRLYRRIKQWRTKGRLKFTVEELREALFIPKGYSPGNINQRILNPIQEELSAVFYGFTIHKKYQIGFKGRKLDYYLFTWKPEPPDQKDLNVSKVLEKTIALYYIQSNKQLSEKPKQKFRAIDRYLGRKLGTTEELYKKKHPNTYFIESTERTKRTMFDRPDLVSLRHYSVSSVKNIIDIYEKLNNKGKLMINDLTDLATMETLLLEKEIALHQKLEEEGKVFRQTHNTIADKMYNVREISINDENRDVIKGYIYGEIKKQFGASKHPSYSEEV